MKKYILSILILTTALNTLLAQGKKLEQLKIGDQLPDLELAYTQNGQHKTIRTGDLKDKLVIFDFWNIWCGSCIALMPELVKFQHEFANDLQIIPVTNNSDQQIKVQFEKIAKRLSDGTSPYDALNKLASVVNDAQLHQLFPHQAVPHDVWIKDGKVIFITGGTDINAQTIKKVIQAEKVALVEKSDVSGFDFKVPLYKEGAGRLLKYLKYYGMVYKNAPEFRNSKLSEKTDTAEQAYRLKCINFTLLNLYKQATVSKYQYLLFTKNRLALEVRDSSKFFWPKDLSKNSLWAMENQYSYELSIPLSKKEQAYAMMLDDLNRFLPYTGGVEKRVKKCLVLIKTGPNNAPVSSAAKKPLIYTEGTTIRIENGSTADLLLTGLASLNAKVDLPIIDGTGFKGRVKIELKHVDGTLDTIIGQLQNQGFDLITREMEIDMLVIKDN